MSALGAVEAAAPGGPALFRPLSAEDGEQQPAEIESLCMNCFRNVRVERGVDGDGRRGALGDEACGRPEPGGVWGWSPAGQGRAGRAPAPSGSSLLQGVTRLLLTRIPFFKEIIVSSFACESCSWSNTEIQSAGRIQEQGVRYALAVASRQVSSTAWLLLAKSWVCSKGSWGPPSELPCVSLFPMCCSYLRIKAPVPFERELFICSNLLVPKRMHY